ncbi:phage portal protein [Jiella marina]|uniref:phage portal protein n=1 Tax=Jiella sp. LLJ827 TaxID=2917712 RepID=UPI002100B121|nr:phage portal protein [Jiella sp. LLJ827]MCQ0987538.1 phage portal protein [Jiella sp. LLJ827]
MGWFSRMLGRARKTKDIEPWRVGAASSENGDNFVTNQVTVADHRDLSVARGASAVGLSATWACVQLIAGTIASLPLMVYRTDASGLRSVAKDHPLYFVLHDSPNYDQTAVDFWEVMAASIELQGNAYAQMSPRSGGGINALLPLPADKMRVRRRSDGVLIYEWTEDSKRTELTGEQVLHIRGPFGTALSGASTLSVCRSVFDGALSAEAAADAMFRNGVNPSGILSTPESVTLTKEQREEMEALLIRKFRGAVRAGHPMLLDRGLTWKQLALNPEDAQMLDSRKFSGEEICRIFGVPPAMVGFGDKSSNWGTGKEVDVLGFQKFTLRKRLKRIEQALTKQLIPLAERRSQGLTIEFNLEGLLRGDSAGRAEFYSKMAQGGFMTINEIRALENLPPVSGGDTPRMQSQNVPITEAGNGQ